MYTSIAKDCILRFLQVAFASPTLFSDKYNPYLYSEDEKTSKLMIADYNTENLNSINIKPALLILRGQATPQTIGLGDKANESFLGGAERRELLMNVGITVNCISREGLEAELLAVSVFKMIRYMRDVIMKDFGVFDVNAVAIGSENNIQREATHVLVSVPVSIQVAVPDAVDISFRNIQLSQLTVGDVVFKAV